MRTLLIHACALWLATLLGIPRPSPAAPEAARNLLPNPGLEGAATRALPAHWEPLIIGAAARFALDAEEKHGGRQSVRITAPEITRSYLHSDPIPVAPGEQIRIGAWVKHRDVPPGQGTVIAIAEFTNAAGKNPQVAKVGVAATADERPTTNDQRSPADARSTPSPSVGGRPTLVVGRSSLVEPRAWQHLEGTVTVPPLCANLRLRLGFSYSRGTCWWDDVTVDAVQPLVARIELAQARVVPAIETLPVTLLNRAGARGPSRLRVRLGTEETLQEVTLTGAPVQRVGVPFHVGRRGRLPLQLALLQPGREAPLFVEERTVTVPPPLVLLPPIPTHWAVEDGVPSLQGEVELAVTSAEHERGTLEARLVDAGGLAHATWSSATRRLPAEGVIHFSLRAPGLPLGEYRVVVEFSGVHAEQRWAVIPRAKAQVTLNRDGYLEQDGKAIFPLGLFNGGARMEEAAAAGFTVAHAYNAVRVEPGERPDDQRASDFLDRAGKAEMRVLFFVSFRLAATGDWEGFRRRIRMFRNHPALLAWDEEEGIARGDMPPATLAKSRQVLREEDPHHPLMVGDSRDVIGRVTDRANFFPLASMDLGMWWWYPFPLAARPGSALEGEEAARTLELEPPSFLTRRNTEKPIWVGVQSYKKPNPGARYPTPAEYRAQAYLALIHGARGLLWYGGSVTGGLFLSPQEGHWEELKKLAKELNGMAPVFMAPSVDAPRFLPADAPISVALKRLANRRVLIAANRGPKPVEITFHLANLAAAPIPVLGENRSITAAAGELRDRFEPYAVHVYELPSP